MNLNDWLDNLFNKKGSKGEPLVAENIVRSEKYKQKRAEITAHPVWIGFAENIYNLVTKKQSHAAVAGIEPGFYQSDKANGFYLSKLEDFELDWFRFLADHMIEKLQEESYTLQRHIAEYSEQNGQSVCWEKSYLKPRLEYKNHQQIQRFGNVQIELKIVNGKAKLFKLQNNYYSGFNYQEPKAYLELLVLLFAMRS